MGFQMDKSINSIDELEATQLATLKALVSSDIQVSDLSDLARIPVTRKDELLKSQANQPPFGLLRPKDYKQIFQSPGPIYEARLAGADTWRFGRFFAAMGIGKNDIVQNTFSYHFTPAGAMIDSAAEAVNAVVFPAGPGNTRGQCEVAAAIKTTVYAGTPDFLGIILDKADQEGADLSSLKHAAVSAGPLFPQLRQKYLDRGILCRQCYGTADVGLIAYESREDMDGMLVDQDVIVEIVSPGTDDPVAEGEIGEVVVTVLNVAHPIIRFSVGDLSAFAASTASQKKIVGWRGRADQATKVKGMFIRPEQISTIVGRHPDIDRARLEVSFDGTSDQINLMVESEQPQSEHLLAEVITLVQETLKLKADVALVAKGELPRDGVLVSDLRASAST